MLKISGFAFLQIRIEYIITNRQETKLVKAFLNLEIASNLKKVLFGICQGESTQHLIIALTIVNAIIRGCQNIAVLIYLV